MSKKEKRIRQFISISLLTLLIIGGFKLTSYASESIHRSADLAAISQHTIVPITFQTGDSVWKIQSSLLPDGNMDQIMGLLKTINKGKDLGQVKTGDVIYFLK